MLKKLYLCSLFILIAASAFTQESKTVIPKDEGKDAFYKPRIGLGAGIFTYFGEVRDNTISHIFTSSMALST